MDVISINQPWASAIASRLKTVETRLHNRFKGLVGKTIAIHATAKYDVDAEKDLVKYEAMSDARVWEFAHIRQAIICTAYIHDAYWLDGKQSELYSKWSLVDCVNVRRFGLFIVQVEVLATPYPCKGKQGIWKIDQSLWEGK